jgi:septum formation protein
MNFRKPIILASASPRRSQLLREAGFNFTVYPTNVDETWHPSLDILSVASYISIQKAKPLILQSETSIIISADTIVALETQILGKPKDCAESVEMLRLLSGKMHLVITGVTVLFQGKFNTFTEVTEVYFRKLTESEIQYYVNQYQPLDKAGAYGIQEYIGLIGVERIVGDYYNVMGLPICRLSQELHRFRYV